MTQDIYTTARMDLTPARWIWLLSQRTLPNTLVLFRRTFTLDKLPHRVTGWITADSRYRLTVNGQRAQWGPTPSDPRWLDVDPVELTNLLRVGENVLGVEVLYYGYGEGTWVGGKPGLLCRFELEYEDDTSKEIITSDLSWMTYLDRAHRPGQFRRSYLRALQEDFDARLHPHGWGQPGFTPDHAWRPAMIIEDRATVPAAASRYLDYLGDTQIPESVPKGLLARQIPLLHEELVPVRRLQDVRRVIWQQDPRDWFEFRTPDAFHIDTTPLQSNIDGEGWEFLATDKQQEEVTSAPEIQVGMIATFELEEQIVGWPVLEIEAAEGTIIEMVTQEGHDPAHTAWLDNNLFTWSRLTCCEGMNRFELFDFESLRWLQLHIHHASRPVRVRSVNVRRRQFDWPYEPLIECAEPELQRLFSASLNTLRNSAQDTCVDGMGRERQQYSGDGGHQLQAIRAFFGETGLPARFLRTFSEGTALDGYFFDSWPGYDRPMRIAQRQVQFTDWGPMLDHSIGFGFDCWHHYIESGDLMAARVPYPRLLRSIDYLEGLRDEYGLLPVKGLNVVSVWIDHEAYRQQRHKQCAFNLYAAAMLQHALSPLARALDDSEQALRLERLGRDLLAATIQRYWSTEHHLFVNNLPWLAEEGGNISLCDRSLATSILYAQSPEGPENEDSQAAQALIACPPELGISYPANACWRYWALARVGRTDVVLADLRARWSTMASVIENNTLQEFWHAAPDSNAQWSHCPIVPLNLLANGFVGLRPTAPGFASYEIQPCPGGLPPTHLRLYTPQGHLDARFAPGQQEYRVEFVTPQSGNGILILPHNGHVEGLNSKGYTEGETQRITLRAGQRYCAWFPM